MGKPVMRETGHLYRQLRLAMAERKRFGLATVVKAAGDGPGELCGQKLLVTESGACGSLLRSRLGAAIESLVRQAWQQQAPGLHELAAESGPVTLFVEPFPPAARLLVLGGGHIARPLAAIGAMLDYEVTVIDDRPSFANQDRFPQAKAVICEDFAPALRQETIDASTSVVIVTRGHQHDLKCLEYVLRSQPGYVGMIGSRRRVGMVRQYLAAGGFPSDLIDRVYMPIGLDIGAETPEEIALSIAAQLIAVRRGLERYPAQPAATGEQWNLLKGMLDYIDRGQPFVAATIIRTAGSTPRKAGAKMLVLPDGSIGGTIGGGCSEAAVCTEALMLFAAGGVKLQRVTMDADVAADEGMACGGVMDIFLESFV